MLDFVDFLKEIALILFWFFIIVTLAKFIARTLQQMRIKRKLTKTILKSLDNAVVEIGGEENEKSNNS